MSQYTTPTLEKLEQALTAHRQGRLDVAGPLYREILAANPEHFDATHLLGLVELHHGRTAEAITLIKKAVGLNNRNASAYSNLGVALRAAGRLEDALAAASRAVTLQTDNIDAQYNRALILLDLHRHEQALAGFRKAVALNPGHADAHTNLGITLQALERLDEALDSLTKANTLHPGHPDTLHNLGHLHQRLKRLPEAAQAFREAIAANPAHAEAHVGLSECLLQMGEIAQGWAEYEWRWSTVLLAPLKRDFPQPVWTGAENIAGKTILIHAEQGLGDTLFAARYVAYVRDRGAHVLLEVPPPLKSLLSCLDCATVFARGEPLPAFDLHCALLSLPALLNLGEDFSAAPYLRAPQTAIDAWRERLGPANGKRCGIVWAASAATRGSGLYRSMPATFLKPLIDSGIAFIGLQPDVPDSDAKALAALPGFTNFGPALQDFADTAGLIANLDAVVSVDTAAAHLTGAMGKPLCVMLAYHSDWRWQMGSGPDSTAWYPSARLIRQPQLHDWQSVVDKVLAALR